MSGPDVAGLTNRIAEHKRVLVNIVKPAICAERAEHYTEAYRRHLDKHVVVRRALALSLHLAKKTIWIKNCELIVGNQASELRAAPIFPEYTVTWVEEEIDGLADRPDGGFAVSDEAKRTIHEICPFWHGRTVYDRSCGLFTDEHKRILASKLLKVEGNMNAGDGHLAVDYEKALHLGLDGLKSVVAKRSHEVDLADWQGLKAEQFLKAVAIALDAVSAYIERYAVLAAKMAADESRECRRDELNQIAANCTLIAHEPPRTFWQALQLCYFLHLILQIESNGHSVSFGRLDQYLYPWYQRDVQETNELTNFQAIELLQSCWLKLLEINKIRSGSHSKASAGSPLYQNVTIGGQKLIAGKPVDAVNPLSYAVLESCKQLRSTQPNLSVRYHSGLTDDFLEGAIGVIRCGFGMPAFNNDEIVIPQFIALGVKPEDAYNYSAIGCIETAVPGKWGYRCTGMSFLNFARVMLLALEGGKDSNTGEVFVPQAKALSEGNFESFDEVMKTWDTQVRYFTRKSIEIETAVDTALEENVPDILCSALVDDCIGRGKAIKEGGAVYDWVSGLQVGIANLGNGLAAIRDLVFEKGKIKQPDLSSALASNFAGIEGEVLRQKLVNEAPKYGNDIDSVDQLLAKAYGSYIDELSHFHNTRFGRGPIGGTYYAGTSSISANVPYGAETAATPDGRKAYSPLAEGSSPSAGTDVNGPTAVFNSVSKLPTAKILGGVLLNQKLNPSTISTSVDTIKLLALLRTFFSDHKGWHVQYNVVSRQTLLAAKTHPEEYRDLVVRVAGYSAFFTSLSPEMQDDIIARTEHTLA